jgi:hypothetical protein
MTILWIPNEVTWKIWADYGNSIPKYHTIVFGTDAGLLFFAGLSGLIVSKVYYPFCVGFYSAVSFIVGTLNFVFGSYLWGMYCKLIHTVLKL